MSRRAVLVATILTAGCSGRTATSGSGGDSGSGATSSGDHGSTSTAGPESTTSTQETGGGISTTTTTDGTTTSHGASETTSTTREPISGTFEGIVRQFYPNQGISVCDPPVAAYVDHWLFDGCDGAYAVIEGTLVPTEWGIDALLWSLEIDDVLEVRWCEAGDCPASSCDEAGGTCPESNCDPVAQDCPGKRCLPWNEGTGVRPHGTDCVPLANSPAGLGEPCNMNSQTPADPDDCDEGLLCWSEDPDSPTGECVALCPTWDPGACAGLCVECAADLVGVCLESCNRCESDPFC
jgi:hypothetical protein